LKHPLDSPLSLKSSHHEIQDAFSSQKQSMLIGCKTIKENVDVWGCALLG